MQLAAYKRRKHGKDSSFHESESTSQDSDSSLSLSPTMLPDNDPKKEDSLQEVASGSSSISEHILSDDRSVENDRSFHEIEVGNTPSSLNVMLRDLSSEGNISQEHKPSPLFSTSLKSDHSLLSLNLMDNLGWYHSISLILNLNDLIA